MGQDHPECPAPSGDTNLSDNLSMATMRVLIVGAGGLGCEILKNLALSGFKRIDVIDMDVIELTNLNRQFLFRKEDIGRSKAEAATEFVKARVPGCQFNAHVAAIQDMSDEFYRQFHLVICGLDSVVARRWINAKICELSQEPGQFSLKPIIDGGSEGLMGQARLILPGLTACYECSLGMLARPADQAFPLCTIASTPRLPEHCVEWARVIAWPDAHQDGREPDLDCTDDLAWLFEKAEERAELYGISGLTLELTYGVVKKIIPALASTNAVIAAMCCVEALKLAEGSEYMLDNYCLYSGSRGVYTHTYPLEKREDCPVCGSNGGQIKVSSTNTLTELIDRLRADFRLTMPSVSAAGQSLYIQQPAALEELTRANLQKPVESLFSTGDELAITDPDLPYPIRVTCVFI